MDVACPVLSAFREGRDPSRRCRRGIFSRLTIAWYSDSAAAVVMLLSYRELMFQKANEYAIFVLDAPLRFQQATHVIIRGRKPGDPGCVCCRGHVCKGRPRHFTDLYGRTKVPRRFFSLDRVNAIINPTVCKTLCLRRFVKVDGAHIELNSEVCA